MAEENEELDNEQEDAGGKSGKGGKGKLILLIVIGVVVIIASIGGTLFALGIFSGGDDAEEVAEAEGGEAATEMVENKPAPAMYFPIKPAIVVNFNSRGRQRFLQADVSILTRDPDVFNAIQTHLPLVKNRLVMLFSGEVYDELQTNEGKELLRQKALESLQEIMQQELGKPGIEEVLFTNFVMQ